jgi:vesicle-fusing ATPase
MLHNDFAGVTIDPILLRLSDPTIEPEYVDPRHCFVIWARPPQRVRDLILRIQNELLAVAPSKLQSTRHEFKYQSV